MGGCFCPCAGEGATLGKDIGCPWEILFLDPFIVFMWFSYELPRESWVMQMMTLLLSLQGPAPASLGCLLGPQQPSVTAPFPQGLQDLGLSLSHGPWVGLATYDSLLHLHQILSSDCKPLESRDCVLASAWLTKHVCQRLLCVTLRSPTCC